MWHLAVGCGLAGLVRRILQPPVDARARTGGRRRPGSSVLSSSPAHFLFFAVPQDRKKFHKSPFLRALAGMFIFCFNTVLGVLLSYLKCERAAASRCAPAHLLRLL